MFLDGISIAAAAAGLVASGLALYGRRFVLPSVLTGPRVCKLEEGGCQILFRTKEASLLGVSNALLGLLYFATIIAGIALDLPGWLLLAGSSAAVAMTIRLAYILIARHLECRICWLGHAANVAVWTLLVAKVCQPEI
ncbi:MAG: vitamin K epoxide reductase family protein [Planctomycetes bacterium]|nr:vitamin K epoxide reductase family protein [Planctomycetota bacterium]